jgi:hypothetical protein
MSLHTEVDCSFMIHDKLPPVTFQCVVLMILITDNEDHGSNHDRNAMSILCALQHEISYSGEFSV